MTSVISLNLNYKSSTVALIFIDLFPSENTRPISYVLLFLFYIQSGNLATSYNYM